MTPSIRQKKRDRADVLAIIAVVLLNLSDAWATFLAVSREAGREMNPLMDFFLTLNPYSFIAVKVFVSVLFLAVMLKYRKHPMARSGVWLVLGVYTAINLMHVIGFILSPTLLGWVNVQ